MENSWQLITFPSLFTLQYLKEIVDDRWKRKPEENYSLMLEIDSLIHERWNMEHGTWNMERGIYSPECLHHIQVIWDILRRKTALLRRHIGTYVPISLYILTIAWRIRGPFWPTSLLISITSWRPWKILDHEKLKSDLKAWNYKSKWTSHPCNRTIRHPSVNPALRQVVTREAHRSVPCDKVLRPQSKQTPAFLLVLT